MIPSDLVLKVGSITKYNDNILIADESLKIGYNETLNAVTKAAALPVAPADGTSKNVSEVPSNLSSFASGVPPYLSLGISLLAFGAFYVFSRK